jgi:competence protein ComEC
MPLFWLATAFVAGLIWGSACAWGWTVWFGIGLSGIVLALFERRFLSHWQAYTTWRVLSHIPVGLVIAALALGGLRYVNSLPAWGPADLAWYNDEGVFRLSGIVQEPPDRSSQRIRLVVAVDQLIATQDEVDAGGPLAVSGLAQVTLPAGKDWRYGDRVELLGELRAPQADSADYYAAYLARQDIYSQVTFPSISLIAHNRGSWFWRAIYDVQDYANRTISRLLPQPESALLDGILLGNIQDLPDSVSQAFRDTGIAHIIAVSGFNVTIVSGVFILLLGKLLRARYAVPLAILGVTAYALLSGGTASVVRAAIMGGVGLIGPLLGRRQVGLNSLAFTAGVMCLFSPQLPWDISFQLSFCATLGLVTYSDLLQGSFLRLAERWLPGSLARRIAGPVGEYFLVTLAAQAFTLPVTAIHFQRVSLSALLANPLVLPVQSLAMILGGLGLLVGMLWLPLGQIVAWACWPLLAYTIRTAELLARIPNTVLNVGQFSQVWVGLYYGLLIGLVLPPVRRRLAALWKPALALALAGLLAVGLWRGVLAAPDGNFHLDALNLADGPALLLRTPGGQAWLVNGSSQVPALADALGRRLPSFSDHLDGLLVTARGAAALQGLETLTQSYSPGLLAIGSHNPVTAAQKRLIAQLKAQGARILPLDEQDPLPAFDVGSGAVLRVLADLPSGTAFQLEWGSFRVLLPGGVPLSGLNLEPLATTSLLILSTDDLKNMSPEIWAANLCPQAVLYSGGSAPPLPGWIELDRYQWVSFHSDGDRLWIEGQLK